MRYVAAIVFLAFVVEAAAASNLTVLFDFDGERSAAAVSEMKNELRQQLRRTGLRLDLRLRSEAGQAEVFEDVVLFRFRGDCRMADVASLMDERGPLAWTHAADGDVLPFGEVACDRVRQAIQSALWGGEHAHRDVLFGRALGRVVAHELVHMLAQTHAHGQTGVTQAALSGIKLIAPDVPPVPEIRKRSRF